MVEQFKVLKNLPRFKNGTILSLPYLTDAMNAPHGADKSTQVYSGEITDATAGVTYELLVEGESVSYEAEAGDDEEAIATALAAAGNGNPLARGLFTFNAVEDTGDWFVTAEANVPRESYNIEVGSGAIDLTELTAGSEGSRFPVGRAVFLENGLAKVEPSTPATGALWVSELRGVSAYRYTEEQETVGSRLPQSIKQRFDVYYVRRGVIGVDTAPEANAGDPVYIETSGDDAGTFHPDNSASREEVPGMEFDGPNRLAIKLF